MKRYRDVARRLAALEGPAARAPVLAYVVVDADGELVSARDTAGRPVAPLDAQDAWNRSSGAVKAYTTAASPDDWPDASQKNQDM